MEHYRPETAEDARNSREGRTFLRQLYNHWQSWIGSILAIPAIVLWQAQGGSMTTYAVIGFSLVGLLWGAFLTWREQYRRAEGLEQEIESLKRPKETRFSLSCSIDDPLCRADWTARETLCLRVNVAHDHPINLVGPCFGKMLRIAFGGKPFPRQETEILPFAKMQEDDSIKKQIPAGTPCQLDVVSVYYGKEQNLVLLPAAEAEFFAPTDSRQHQIFTANNNVYDLYISVHGQGVRPKYAHLKFFWAPIPKESTLELIEQSEKPLFK